MTLFKRVRIACLVWIVLLGVGDLSKEIPILSIPVLAPDAVARVGRPLTPVSVAGVARRTTRRCATGAYNC